MKRKFVSIIIIPHTKGKQKVISFTRKNFKIFASVASFLCLSLLFFLVDYTLMNSLRMKYRDLRKENTEQGKTIADYKKSVLELQGKVEKFERITEKLNIMAGLKAADRLNESAGVGGSEDGYSPNTQIQIPQSLSLSRLKNINEKADGIEKNLNILARKFEKNSYILATTPSIRPTIGYQSSSFGYRKDPFTGKRAFHKGVDISTAYGNPVVATADGVVIRVNKKDKIGGKVIKVSHRGHFITIYCHLSKILVKTGEKVKRGDVIGLVGSTGKSNGPHVHYEVHINNKPVNPYNFFLEED
jgi:murein DD-endopeptidase MepM/ murein hydrolase activator NlpD